MEACRGLVMLLPANISVRATNLYSMHACMLWSVTVGTICTNKIILLSEINIHWEICRFRIIEQSVSIMHAYRCREDKLSGQCSSWREQALSKLEERSVTKFTEGKKTLSPSAASLSPPSSIYSLGFCLYKAREDINGRTVQSLTNNLIIIFTIIFYSDNTILI